MAEIISSNIKPPLPPPSGNISSLVSSDTLNTLSKSSTPQTFGDQLLKIAAQQVLAAASKSKLAQLTKQKATLIQEGVQLDIQHQATLLKLEQAKTPKKQIVNGKETDIPAEITEEEYQAALIIENGGTLPNGQQIKGNYPTAKENLQKRKDENQKQIDDIIKDPFKAQKDQLKKLKSKLNNREKKTKAERKEARKKKVKAVLNGAKAAKSLVPVVTLFLVNKIAEIIAQNDKIGQLVDDTNAIIEEANLSNDPIKLQNAKLARDNAIRIITDNENKIRKINGDIQRISTYINIFTTIINIISAIPIPTAVPPGIGIPVNLIIRFVKILDRANRIVISLSAYLPTVLLSLEKAIQILNDYKSQLLNINGEIDNAATTSGYSNFFLTDPTGTNEFPEYKGFKFAIKEEENPKFVVRGFKRRYAVAINKRGVEALKSEYSFTLDPNDLIDQLKLIIDQRNLSADSPSSFGSIGPNGNTGGGTGEIGGAGNTSSQFQVSTPSSSNISIAQKAAFTKPPEPTDIQGPTKTLTERIPLSIKKKAYLAGLVIAPTPPTPPNIKIDAAYILKEDQKWQAAYKKYKNQASKDILRLES